MRFGAGFNTGGEDWGPGPATRAPVVEDSKGCDTAKLAVKRGFLKLRWLYVLHVNSTDILQTARADTPGTKLQISQTKSQIPPLLYQISILRCHSNVSEYSVTYVATGLSQSIYRHWSISVRVLFFCNNLILYKRVLRIL